MKIRFRFIQDEAIDGIEVVIRAKGKNDEVEALLSKLSSEQNRVISASTLSQEYDIITEDIILVMRDGRYLTARTLSGDYVIKDTLANVEELLDPAWFVKISQSEIINLMYVKRWDFVGGGVIQIEMKNDIICYTSRRYAVRIRKILTKGREK